MGRRPDASRPGWWYRVRATARSSRDTAVKRSSRHGRYQRRLVKFVAIPSSVGLPDCGVLGECHAELESAQVEKLWPDLRLDPVRDLRPRGFSRAKRSEVRGFVATRKRLKLEERAHLVAPYPGAWGGGW